jgi:hypothetical protein
VAHELLHGDQVLAVVEQVTGEGAPEVVPGERLDAGCMGWRRLGLPSCDCRRQVGVLEGADVGGLVHRHETEPRLDAWPMQSIW